jgi:hypothetical protein
MQQASISELVHPEIVDGRPGLVQLRMPEVWQAAGTVLCHRLVTALSELTVVRDADECEGGGETGSSVVGELAGRPFGVCSVGGSPDGGAFGADGVGPAVVDVGRGVQAQPGVAGVRCCTRRSAHRTPSRSCAPAPGSSTANSPNDQKNQQSVTPRVETSA